MGHLSLFVFVDMGGCEYEKINPFIIVVSVVESMFDEQLVVGSSLYTISLLGLTEQVRL